MLKLKSLIDGAFEAIPFLTTIIKLAIVLSLASSLVWIGWKANDFKDKVCDTPVIGRLCHE
jgi:hypothetical protein